MDPYNEKVVREIENCLKQVRYKDAQIVREHAFQACSQIRTLSPKIGILNYDNGKKSTLIFLAGTIPMWYQKVQYNIPVNIWFVEAYPQHAPLAYVVPTPTMAVAPAHKNVDSSGRCYLEYLSSWKPRVHNVYELCNRLTEIFNSEPPVYQKSQIQSSMMQQPPINNNPSSSASSSSSSFYSSSQPAYSGYPPQPNYGSASMYGAASNGSSMAQPYAQPQASQAQQREQARQQLLRKVNEKAHNKVKAIVNAFDLKITEYMNAQEKLGEREKYLLQCEQQMEQDQRRLEQDLTVYEEQSKAIQQYLDENQSKEVDIDKVIAPRDIHSAQSMEALAEIDVLEDMMEALDKLLQKKKIDFELYQKNVRELAKEQFMKKALHLKIVSITRSKRHQAQ